MYSGKTNLFLFSDVILRRDVVKQATNNVQFSVVNVLTLRSQLRTLQQDRIAGHNDSPFGIIQNVPASYQQT